MAQLLDLPQDLLVDICRRLARDDQPSGRATSRTLRAVVDEHCVTWVTVSHDDHFASLLRFPRLGAVHAKAGTRLTRTHTLPASLATLEVLRVDEFADDSFVVPEGCRVCVLADEVRLTGRMTGSLASLRILRTLEPVGLLGQYTALRQLALKADVDAELCGSLQQLTGLRVLSLFAKRHGDERLPDVLRACRGMARLTKLHAFQFEGCSLHELRALCSLRRLELHTGRCHPGAGLAGMQLTALVCGSLSPSLRCACSPTLVELTTWWPVRGTTVTHVLLGSPSLRRFTCPLPASWPEQLLPASDVRFRWAIGDLTTWRGAASSDGKLEMTKGTEPYELQPVRESELQPLKDADVGLAVVLWRAGPRTRPLSLATKLWDVPLQFACRDEAWFASPHGEGHLLGTRLGS